ncbi:MAG: hypothetical protein RJA45_80 [Actinomycetota bacterium]|jgi:uncharacterized repeat protein (TIGR02543 family)
MRRTATLILLALSVMFIAPVGLSSANAATTRSVTLVANGSGQASKVIKTKVSSYKLPHVSFFRPGYSFLGWAKSASGKKVYSDRATVRLTASLKLYALWKEVIPAAPSVPGHTVGKLLWREEFGGAVGAPINSNVWTARYCDQSSGNGGGTCHNNEPQWYLPSAVALDGSSAGNAVITTNRVYAAPAGGVCLAWSGCQFTSARFDTQGKVAFKYGYIESRIKMPAGGRNWPAFWALGENITSVSWPQSGEIDIAEQGRNNPNRNSGAIHYSTNGVANDCCGNHTYDYGDYTGPDYSAAFHTYAMAWTPNRIELLVDGQVFRTFTSSTIRSQHWSFNNPFFLILNNATGDFGGAWTGWTQSQMTIDYVRAWQLDNQGEVFIR